MTRLHLRGALAVLFCGVVLAGVGGCVLGAKSQTTQITITVPGDRVLFMALIPRVLPDGTLSTEKRDALMEEVARKAVGRPLIGEQRGAWAPGADRPPVEETSDVLWAVGRGDLGKLIYESLRDDFGQRVPFVMPIPLQTQMVPSRRRLPGAAQGEAPAGGA